MRPPTLLFTVLAAGFAIWLWHAQLFVVGRSGDPRALVLTPAAARPHIALDVVLPAVPIGMARLHDGEGVLLVHYWAPWQRHAKLQVSTLDSLRRTPGMEHVHVAVVCADPFPSVARFIARQRLRLLVLIDGRRTMRAALPCPSVPYTYVLDARGRVAIAQEGEVDWLAPATRDALERLIEESAREPEPVRPHAL